MKKTLRIASLALCVLLLVLALAACGGDGGTTTPPVPEKTALAELSSFTIIYPYEADADTFRAARELRAAIKEETGIELKMKDDFVGLGQSVPTDTREIIVGRTNRAESYSKRLGAKDTGIYFENGRLVIAGGEGTATAAAVERFVTDYLADGQVFCPGADDIIRSSYPYADLTINGISIYDYVIVRESAYAASATYLSKQLSLLTGAVLPIYGPRDYTGTANEILIGAPAGEGRQPTAAPDGKWVIERRGTRLALYGSGESGAISATLSFFDHLSEKLKGGSLALSYATAMSGDVTEEALFTLNLGPMPSNVGKVDLLITPESVLDRFLSAKESLPDEVTVVERLEVEDYPISHDLQVFVSPSGNDKNPGTKEKPLATLAAALKQVTNKSGGIIWMMEGTYTVDSTVKIDSLHSGTSRSPLFIKAYEDADVTLTTNKQISTDPSLWHFVDAAENEGVYERLPGEARGEVLYTKLSDHGLSVNDFAEITKSAGPPKLYVGGEEYTLARYPNDTGDIKDLLYFTSVYDSGTVTSITGNLYWPWVERAQAAGKDPVTWIVGWEIRIPTEDERGQEIINWVNTGDIWCFGSTFEGWEFGYYNLALETEGQGWAHNADGTAWVPGSGETPYIGYPKGNGNYSLKSVQNNPSGAKHSTNSPAGRNTFYVFNAVEAMDAPGEWYLDRDTGYLYVYPDGALDEKDMSVSNDTTVTVINATGAEHVVIDGIDIDGATNHGYYLDSVNSFVVQNVRVANTRASNLQVRGMSRNVAVIYSDFSRANSALVSLSVNHTTASLTPSNVVVQNCIFHDPLPTYQGGVSYSGCRTVISHNYFSNTNVSGGTSAEAIVEYNRFEGGSKDITDGGMCYTWGYSTRGNHYRYNLFHMFNATHNAIYNDGTSSSNYAYGNMISFLGSKSNRNKGWYSSTGTGNVCYGNVMILRNPYQVAASGASGGFEGDIVPANSGDSVNESNLFYYYFGDEYSAGGAAARYTPRSYDGVAQLSGGGSLSQSLAGHWWMDMKDDEYALFFNTFDPEAWEKWDPQHMNYLQGTQLILAALRESDYHPKYFYVPWYLTGKTFTYDGLPAGTVLQIPDYYYLNDGGTKTLVEAHAETVGEDGTVTLTYEEIAAMERFRRQPACSVITNNILLGGTPTYEGGKFTTTSDPKMIITDGCLGCQGYISTTLAEKNVFEYDYDEILMDAEGYDYELVDYAYDLAEQIMDEDGYAMIAEAKWFDCGLTYSYDYTQWWAD